MPRRLLLVPVLIALALLTLAACGGTPAVTSAPPTSAAPAATNPPAATSAPAATNAPAATSAPAATTASTGNALKVALVDHPMTQDEIAAAIKNEGTVTVANWTYTANDAIKAQFEAYVKKTYGADIKLNYEGSQSPSIYLTNLYTAQKAGNPSPYDVMAIEENYYYDAKKNNAVADVFPSDLIPNWNRVDASFRHDPQAVGFQSSASPAPIYHADKVNFLKDWKDLADPRLKGRITMPLSGDVTSGGFLIGMAWSLGKDYHNDQQMTETIDYVCTKVHPNVLKYTTDSSEMQQLLRAGTIDVAGFWNSLARLEFFSGAENTKDTTYTPMASGQPAVNGFMWVPKGAAHPILAQVFIDWRLSDDGQFPSDAWGIPHNAWAEYNEDVLGPSYEKDIPMWFTDYFKYYPKFDQLKSAYKSVDWDFYAGHVDAWMKQYSKCAG